MQIFNATHALVENVCVLLGHPHQNNIIIRSITCKQLSVKARAPALIKQQKRATILRPIVRESSTQNTCHSKVFYFINFFHASAF